MEDWVGMMKLGKIFRAGVVWTSCLSMLTAAVAQASGPVQQARTIEPLTTVAGADVALEDGGVLLGQVVDRQGIPRGRG